MHSLMRWEDYYQQYALTQSRVADRLAPPTPQIAARVQKLNAERELLVCTVAHAFTHLTDAERGWFDDVLRDDKRKWFVLFVLRSADVVPDFLFEPLVYAAVYEPDPSYNGFYVHPALVTFGWRRVNERLLRYIERGSIHEKAGAINAMYWSRMRYVHWKGQQVDCTEDISDLLIRTRQLFLRTFVENQDVDVRRNLIPDLNLEPSAYPEAFLPLIARAIEIATNHSDPYIRQRLRLQLGKPGLFPTLTARKQP